MRILSKILKLFLHDKSRCLSQEKKGKMILNPKCMISSNVNMPEG